jgi:DNA polymerase-3 subunit alpha
MGNFKEIVSVELVVKEKGVSATQWYIDVLNGRREAKYIHPDLEEILKETYGVICYQEQLMSILVKFCGYTLEESDQIRSAIAKKKKDVMIKAYQKVRKETQKIGWTLEQAEDLCKVLTAYSNYSFNRSHACISYNQLIKTKNGSKFIADITTDDEVLTKNTIGESYMYPLSDAIYMGDKDVYEVELSDGSFIKLTLDHIVATESGWMTVEEAFLNGEDIICVHRSNVNAD